MRKFKLSSIESLTPSTITSIIQQFSTEHLATLKRRENYDNGKHKILFRESTDVGKPNNKSVVNFVRQTIDTYSGYAVGISPTFSGEGDLQGINDILAYSDINELCEQYFRSACIYGYGAALCYINEYGKQQIKLLDSKEIIPIYSDTVSEDLIAVIRPYQLYLNADISPSYFVDVYDDKYISHYSASMGYASVTLISQEAHHYEQVPITIFPLNKDEEALCEQGFSLVDSYESLLSDGINNYDSFVDAYLVLYGMQADERDLENMKKHRVLMMDNDSKAEYLTKDVSVSEIQFLLETVEDKFREVVSCPNFSDESFGTSSGIAMKMKILGMENRVSGILANMKKALTRIVELLAEVERLFNPDLVIEQLAIQFHRNLPVDKQAEATALMAYRGLVSDHTLLSQIDFVKDVDEELKLIAEENELNRQQYDLSNPFAMSEDNDE